MGDHPRSAPAREAEPSRSSARADPVSGRIEVCQGEASGDRSGDGVGHGDAAGGPPRDAGARTERKEQLLQRALQEMELLEGKAAQADAQRRRCLEASRGSRRYIRILGRIRPPLSNEEHDVSCLRVLDKGHLEVTAEPRASIAEPPPAVGRARGAQGALEASPGRRSTSSTLLSDSYHSVSNVCLEPRTFRFDDVLDVDAGDEVVFEALRGEIIAAVEGEAVCILAYGATGSGKTHTVSNLAEQAAVELERQARSLAQGGRHLEIQAQIVEIYNEQLRDLLGPAVGHRCEPRRLRVATADGGPVLLGAASHPIGAGDPAGIAAGIQEAYRLGQALRATCATAVHGRSSRSHLVMTLSLTVWECQSQVAKSCGKLSLVDLAGSERLKKSEAEGQRLIEAQHINRSLSALSDVISAKERRLGHVPYRNSKLTYLLQDALGGQQRCRTVVIVAVPPGRSSLGETIHSLQFSARLSALSVPTVPAASSRKSLRGTDAWTRLPQQTDDVEGGLEAELARWRREYASTRAELEACRGQLQAKERQLRDAERRHTHLLATTEGFERSREQLMLGFAAVDFRLQDLESAALRQTSSSSADVADSAAPSQLCPAVPSAADVGDSPLPPEQDFARAPPLTARARAPDEGRPPASGIGLRHASLAGRAAQPASREALQDCGSSSASSSGSGSPPAAPDAVCSGDCAAGSPRPAAVPEFAAAHAPLAQFESPGPMLAGVDSCPGSHSPQRHAGLLPEQTVEAVEHLRQAERPSDRSPDKDGAPGAALPLRDASFSPPTSMIVQRGGQQATSPRRRYVVEVISEARARELAASAPLGWPAACRATPGGDSEPLVQAQVDAGRGRALLLGEVDACMDDHLVSESSDEEEIRNRLRKSLNLGLASRASGSAAGRGPSPPAAVARGAARSSTGAARSGGAARPQTSQRAGGRAARASRSPTVGDRRDAATSVRSTSAHAGAPAFGPHSSASSTRRRGAEAGRSPAPPRASLAAGPRAPAAPQQSRYAPVLASRPAGSRTWR